MKLLFAYRDLQRTPVIATAQLLVSAGQSEASVQTTMRHATASMTRRYAMQKDRGENANALAEVLFKERSA